MELCLAAKRKPGLRLSSKWWEQPALDITGIRVEHAVAKEGGRDGIGVIGGRGIWRVG